MSRAMTGAWQGLGQGVARAGEMAYGAHLSERAEQRRIELQSKLRGEERAEDRAFQKDMAEQASKDAESRIRLQAALQKEVSKENQTTWKDEYDESGKLIGQRASTGKLDIFPPIKAVMDPTLKVQLDQVTAEAAHLRNMERDIRTKRTDEFGNALVPDDEGDQLLQEVRERQQAVAEKFNRLLGKTKSSPAESKILTDAMTLPEEDQAEFLADLEASGRATPALIAAVQALWTPNQAAAEEAPPAAKPETPPAGGLIEQASGESSSEAGLITQAKEPMANESPAAESKPRDPRPNPNDGVPWTQHKLGPYLESGARAVGDTLEQVADSNVRKAAQELAQIARGEKEPYQGSIRQFLMSNPSALKLLSAEDVDRLKQRYGERLINQFLK